MSVLVNSWLLSSRHHLYTRQRIFNQQKLGHSMTPKHSSDFKTLDRKNMTIQSPEHDPEESNIYSSHRPVHRKLNSRPASPKNQRKKVRARSRQSDAEVHDSKARVSKKLQQERAEK